MERLDREADGPGAAILRPKHGWMRQQLRYLVPAAAAAARVVVVVRYGGMRPVAPAPAVPPAVSEPAAPVSAEQRIAKAEPGPRAAKKAESPAVSRRVPPPATANERLATVTREERDRLADRSPPGGSEEASRDRAAAPAAIGVPSPPVNAADGMPPGSPAERKKMTGAAAPMAERRASDMAESASGMRMPKERAAEAPPADSLGKTRSEAGPASLATAPAPAPAASPCELARTLAARERWKAAEDSQRACLAGDPDAPAREKGLVFLAELLDRQARFAEADAVIAEVDRTFPQSRPLDLYRQQRPMVQRQPVPVPGTR
jgi:hypothetical protein